MLIGSLVLSSKGNPTKLFCFTEETTTGNHVPGRQNGKWWMTHDMLDKEIYLPQRDKGIHVSFDETNLIDELEFRLSSLDSILAGQNQISKYNVLYRHMTDKSNRFLVVMNNVGTHGSWGFLSKGEPLYLYGIYNDNEVQLIWTTDNLLIDSIRSMYPLKFSIYRFPVILDMPLFISTQAISSKWWRWSSSSKTDPLLCFNALELMIFKHVTLRN